MLSLLVLLDGWLAFLSQVGRQSPHLMAAWKQQTEVARAHIGSVGRVHLPLATCCLLVSNVVGQTDRQTDTGEHSMCQLHSPTHLAQCPWGKRFLMHCMACLGHALVSAAVPEKIASFQSALML